MYPALSCTIATGANRFKPRQSFAAWHEGAKHTPAPWVRAEILTVLGLREGILRVISQKTNETCRVNEKWKEPCDGLDTFSHTISHDLPKLISVIKNYVEILIDAYDELLPDEAKSMLVRISAGADQMHTLVPSVLAYSHLNKIATWVQKEIMISELLGDMVKQAHTVVKGEVFGAVTANP